MPQVSVIIPARNAEKTIVSAVRSALGQTWSDLEVIVIDDGSSDGTLARLATLKDERLRVLTCGKRGVAAARNQGIELARGEFISFLDADDLWTADKIEAQVKALESRPDAGAAYSWTAFMDEQGKFLFAKDPQVIDGDVYQELLVKFFLASGSNLLVRRQCVESVGAFDAACQPVEDWEYSLRIARHCRFVLVPRYQILYRFGIGSASTDVERYEERIRAVVEREFEKASGDLRSRREECLANASQHMAIMCLARILHERARGQAARFLKESVRIFPAVLIKRRTWSLFVAVGLVYLVPRRRAASLVTRLLRLYGTCMRAANSELRRQIDPHGVALR
jgi:glycosyltransferase involved in cell wall biosynthesis